MEMSFKLKTRRGSTPSQIGKHGESCEPEGYERDIFIFERTGRRVQKRDDRIGDHYSGFLSPRANRLLMIAEIAVARIDGLAMMAANGLNHL